MAPATLPVCWRGEALGGSEPGHRLFWRERNPSRVSSGVQFRAVGPPLSRAMIGGGNGPYNRQSVLANCTGSAGAHPSPKGCRQHPSLIPGGGGKK